MGSGGWGVEGMERRVGRGEWGEEGGEREVERCEPYNV